MIDSFLENLNFLDIGAGGIVILGVLMLMRGQIVAKSVVDRVVENYEKQITRSDANADKWRAAYEGQVEVTNELTGQVGALLELSRTSVSAFESIQAEARAIQAKPDAGGVG